MTNLSFESGKTYIIDNDIILTEDLLLPENITLIFQGGMFKSESEVKVIGNNTALIAPIAPIFGINVSVPGSWLIDCAYPQWFETTTFKFTTHCSDTTNIPYTRYPEDMADSIQKAINMKSSGCVCLIGGDYYITKPLFIPWGISLEGPCAQEYATSTAGRPLAATIYPAVKDLATEHFSCSENGDLDGRDPYNVFPSDYLIYINSTENKEEIDGNTYSDPFIAIKGITFINYPLIHPSSRCIFASSGVQLDYVNWFQFMQAIDYNPNAYIDYKSITHCSFKGNLPQGEDGILPLPDPDNSGEEIYAFDLHGLGDASIFTNNEIGTFLPHQKMLRLHQCAGASVDANVINGDVTIIASKAISYTNNHMENGAQILIDSSIVSMQSNFIEKGPRVSLLIQCLKENDINKYEEYGQNIVSIHDTQFVYYDTDRYPSEAPEEGSTIKDERKYQAKENRLRNINETDILIDSSSILNIENTYRYNLNRNH